MWIPFILAMLLEYGTPAEKKGAQYIAVIGISTLLGIVLAMVFGFLAPTQAIEITTQADAIAIIWQYALCSIIGVVTSRILRGSIDWIGKVKA